MYEPLEVPLGKACGCICPACREQIIAKHCRASTRLAHFAHLARADCSSGFETAVHLAAKQLIAERGQLHFPALVVTVHCVDAIGVEHRASVEIAVAGMRFLSRVVLEQWTMTIRPDVIVCAGALGEVIVEIAVTHFVDEEKRDKIERLGLAAIEIDLPGLREATFDAIAVLLFDTPSKSKWLHHPRITDVRAQLLDGLAERLAHAARLVAENHELWEGQRVQAQRDMDECMKQHAVRLQEQKLLAEQESLARRQIHQAIIDWYSRRVLAWRISNSMDASFCVDCLEEALIGHGKPEIFNTDQGSQFTSVAFTAVLKRAGIDISMDGRGRALNNIFVERLWRNVKYEDVYLNGYATMGDLHEGLTRYFAFYNGDRPHQALNYLTPDRVYASGEGGGAMIVDKYGSVSAPEGHASSAGEHGALPQTPPCREPTAMTSTFMGG